jgi:endoglucanase
MFSTFARTATAGAFVVAWLALSAQARAQSRPFPTSGRYAQGFVPSAATAAAAQASYASWKTHYLKNDCGNGYYRVDNGSGDASTFSEGQGYGMVLTAYFGDQTQFDGLWAFAQKNFNTSHLMGWHVTCSGFTMSDGGDGSATDGDTDIGFALIVAGVQWGGTYAEQAKTYLATLKTVDFTSCSATGRNVATAGSWQGNQACTTSGGGSNTSYWMPGYYRVFAALTGDTFWSKTADDVVALYGLAANPKTGIVVNEVDQTGAPVSGQTYDYNSCRIPWRAALDYVWFGTAGAKQETTLLTEWVNTVGIAKTVDGYKADGTPSGQYTGLNAFVGGFAVGAMSDSQAIADSFGSYFVGIADDNGGYYGASLRTLYLLTLSGNEWNPMDSLGDGGSPSQTDSGVPAVPDSGEPVQPAGGSGDAGNAVGTQTAADTTADAGMTSGHSSAGCGCRIGGAGPRWAGPWALALLAGVGFSRRRQPRARDAVAHRRGARRITSLASPARTAPPRKRWG